jgi:hypothetical protein
MKLKFYKTSHVVAITQGFCQNLTYRAGEELEYEKPIASNSGFTVVQDGAAVYVVETLSIHEAAIDITMEDIRDCQRSLGKS